MTKPTTHSATIVDIGDKSERAIVTDLGGDHKPICLEFWTRNLDGKFEAWFITLSRDEAKRLAAALEREA
jgi:hypothetical protein